MIKKLIKTVFYFVLGGVIIIGLYYASGKVLGKIEVSGDVCESPTITCYLKSNGTHTDLVIPIKNEVYDWNEFITQTNNEKTLETATYIAIGWGDKGFYLNTPQWEDLTFTTAFNAGFGLSTSAMHVTYYSAITETKHCVKMEICETQYRKLVQVIRQKFQLKGNHVLIINTDQNYGRHDSFYEAKGRYNIFTTCNVWVSQTLKRSGIKTGLWTPFSAEVLEHYQ